MNPGKSIEFYTKFSLLLALPLMAYQYIAYAIGVSFMVSTLGNLIPLTLKFMLLFVIAKYAREKAGGYADFATMFKTMMPVLFFGSLLTVLNEVALYSAIDPSLEDKVFDASVNQIGGYMKMFGADEETISNLKSRMVNAHYSENQADRYSIAGTLGAWLTSVVMWVIPVTIISWIMKKEDKTFTP